jgi:hypothetical protein
MAKLQKLPGRPAELGMYRLTGDLADVPTPGRRTVRVLEVRADGGPADGLSALTQFTSLERLTLNGVDGMRLEPLAELALTQLIVADSRGLDLAPLAGLAGLESLWLTSLADCRVPDRLRLPASLRALVLLQDDPAVLEALVRAIDWEALGALRELDLAATGTPARVDLGFLTGLGELERLELASGVIHRGPGPSPLDPPFPGLSRKLTWLRFESDDPERVQQELYREIAPTGVVAFPRASSDGEGEDWAILAPEAADDPWQVYGSLADAYGEQLEHDALRTARARLREADPALLRRLDFDQEADGTGIYARSREDVERALEILGLSGP